MQSVELKQVISVDKDKCVNCHICINACPVKYCNDGSGDVVAVNNNMCIACGNCLTSCTHGARHYIDDFHKFLADANIGVKMVAIVAPSVAANFPGKFLNINGWLKHMGVSAVFDVSFGAELTVASYLHHIRCNKPKVVIAQPCAAIVTYIETFRPELIQYLAPADSPMVHTMKMIQTFYTQYADHKIVVLSPCIAKKREFEETGYGDYNLAFTSINEYFNEKSISLDSFPRAEYDNPPAERAVLFSSPGGLLQTAERWIPEIRSKTRKIEGVHTVYEYLDRLPGMIDKGISPLLIDCLNCEKGCNGGPLSLGKEYSIDELEYWVTKRKEEMQAFYMAQEPGNNSTNKHLEDLLMKYWDETLYKRSYVDRSTNNAIRHPNKYELDVIYQKMHKYSEADIFNCSACGYNSCEKMATAILNGLNKPENCHFYLSKERNIAHEETIKEQQRIFNIINSMSESFLQLDNNSVIISTNPSAEKLLKTRKLVGKKITDFIEPSFQEIYKNLQLELLKNDAIRVELCLKDAEGGDLFCLLNENVFRENANTITITGSFIIITDLTDRKLFEIALEKYNDELEGKVAERTQELTASIEELRQAEEEIVSQRDAIEEKAANLEGALYMLKKSQDKLVESEKMVALGQLIAGVAHEINTPLGAIRSSMTNITSSLSHVLSSVPDFVRALPEEEKDMFFALLHQSLQQTLSLSAKEERSIKRKIVTQLEETNIDNAHEVADTLVDMGIYDNIEQFITVFQSHKGDQMLHFAYKMSGLMRSCKTVNIATERASKVVFALKNFSHFDHRGEKVDTNVVENIETVITLYHNQMKHGVTLSKNYHSTPVIPAYPDELNQVWTNLIHNSLQAMNNMGSIEIDLSETNDFVQVLITDSGSGIPAEIQDKIFNPFFTTKPQGEGSGLGLDIVRRIVEKHNGSITFESQPGKTTFKVTLASKNHIKPTN